MVWDLVYYVLYFLCIKLKGAFCSRRPTTNLVPKKNPCRLLLSKQTREKVFRLELFSKSLQEFIIEKALVVFNHMDFLNFLFIMNEMAEQHALFGPLFHSSLQPFRDITVWLVPRKNMTNAIGYGSVCKSKSPGGINQMEGRPQAFYTALLGFRWYQPHVANHRPRSHMTRFARSALLLWQIKEVYK